MIINYFKIIDEENRPLLKLIEKHIINKAQHFPIFAFAKINPTISTIHKLKTQQIDKLKEFKSNMKDICKTTHRNVQDILNDVSISISNKNYAIIYSILNNNLDLNDVEKYLLQYKNKSITDYKRILCAYDFMKYNDGKSIQ